MGLCVYSGVFTCIPEYFIYHWKTEPEVSGAGQMGNSGKLSSGLWESTLFLQPLLCWWEWEWECGGREVGGSMEEQ